MVSGANVIGNGIIQLDLTSIKNSYIHQHAMYVHMTTI